jgi:guanosine-3',5'-bis(diphosphate) 3'-pyrophosphohydrolase
MLGKAIRIASEAFEYIKDKGGKPYILHCLRVMNNLNSNDDELNSIAVLHDFVEDFGGDDHEKMYNIIKNAGFSARVITALRLLTHIKGVPYDDYIKQLAHNEDARRVKLADLKDNSDITRLKGLTKKDFDKMEKYHRSFIYLSKV